MDDPNSAAAANAVQAGANFWGRVQNMRQNRFQAQQIGIEQQNADTEKARQQTSDKAQKLQEDTFNQVTLPAAKTSQQLANVGLAQAQKQEFLQSHDPIPSAAQSWGQQQAQNFSSGVKPITFGDNNPDLTIMQMPTPKDSATRQALGVPDNYTDDTWQMMPKDFEAAAPKLAQLAPQIVQQEFSKPYDEMSPEAQAAVRESYQKNAPPGVKISDGEAAMAFRAQQREANPPPSMAGMTPISAEYNPADPYSAKIQLQAPIGGGSGAAVTPSQYTAFGEPLQQLVSKNPELLAAQTTAQHVANVISYASDPHPSVTSDKSLIMSYLKSIDPTVRVSEGTVTTVMDGMGVPEEIQNAAAKVMTGSVFTPEKREWFKNAAIQNLENARRSAANSLQAQLAISAATGNPLAKGVKLPPSVLPPSQRGPGGSRSDASVSGSDSQSPGSGVKKFNSLAQAEAANLPPGTQVMIFDSAKGGYRRAISQ